ncbi:small ribosomal subunit protein mS22 [Phlebotomus argentipes]|uniref:small ribosomal subunit protein mS22 n=1 Tax=Phlebotomus argentipes TaxID=94469 RepID=UPI0028930ED9|nr:small ribosomal subunit protein mS22 [Phlebotomus argentipes]
MFSLRDCSKIPNFSQKFIALAITSHRRCSTGARAVQHYSYDRDPAPQFFSGKVQKLLKSLTRMDLDKVFRRRTMPRNTVNYKFLTTEQVQREVEDGLRKARRLLQMPPVVQIKEPEHKIISDDTGLANYSTSDIIFTDITYGVSDFKRKIFIRKVDGKLESAPQDVRKRLNQIYFPSVGRTIRTPKMFEPEYLKKCLEDHKYEFILNRLTVQFEPYEKDFHDVAAQTFLHLNESREFNQLRSTRHFGPMAFFLAWHRLTDNLLFDMIKRDFLMNGVELVELQCHLNNLPLPAEELFNQLNSLRGQETTSGSALEHQIENQVGKSEEELTLDRLCMDILKEFVQSHAQKKAQLELALQTHAEALEEKKRILDGLKTAHGIN